MSHAGITGMRCAAEDILAVTDHLNDSQWHQPSAATGWSVKDVVCHVGCLLELLQAAVAGAAAPEIGIEALNDAQVAQRRDWTPTHVVDYLRAQLTSAITVFTTLQEEPVASVQTTMLDLGSYPLHAIADMFAFDMITHLRYDILTPRGPITDTVDPLDEQRLTPAIAWLLGGITQMQPELATHLRAPLALNLTGPAAQHILISRAQNPGATTLLEVRPDPAAGLAAATITSTTADFLAWSTTRLPWYDHVTITGDSDTAIEFLDALNLV
jgi:uncharacterized protein (TIGR03083 family)